MGYILDLRRKVGHERLIMVGAGVLPYRDGKLLLQRRRDNDFWADHGGSLEPGEELEQTAWLAWQLRSCPELVPPMEASYVSIS